MDKTEGVFVASTSGNTCRYSVQTSGDETRVGISSTWSWKPNEDDMRQFESFIIGRTTRPGGQIPEVEVCFQGSTSTGGKQRSEVAVKRFVETGHPGVPTLKRRSQ